MSQKEVEALIGPGKVTQSGNLRPNSQKTILWEDRKGSQFTADFVNDKVVRTVGFNLPKPK